MSTSCVDGRPIFEHAAPVSKGWRPVTLPVSGSVAEICVHAFPAWHYMAESIFRGYETALRLHTPEAALASYPGLGGGAGIIYLMN